MWLTAVVTTNVLNLESNHINIIIPRVKNFNDLSSFCLQAEEAREHCKACQIDVGDKRVDLANTKSVIITQIREMVSQCDLTLKAVSSNLCAENVYHDYLTFRPTWIAEIMCYILDIHMRRHSMPDSQVHVFVSCFRWRSTGSSSSRPRLYHSLSTTRACVKMPNCTSRASAISTLSGVYPLMGLVWSPIRLIQLSHKTQGETSRHCC